MSDPHMAGGVRVTEPVCGCVGYTIRTDYGTGIEHDVDRSSCPIHGLIASLPDDTIAPIANPDRVIPR